MKKRLAVKIVERANEVQTLTDDKQALVAGLMRDGNKQTIPTSAAVLVQSAIQISHGITGNYKSWKGTGHTNLYDLVNCIVSCEGTIKTAFKSLAEKFGLMGAVIEEEIASLTGKDNELAAKIEKIHSELKSWNVKAIIKSFDIVRAKECRLALIQLSLEFQALIPPKEKVKTPTKTPTKTPAVTPAETPEKSKDKTQAIEPDDKTNKLEAAIEAVAKLCTDQNDLDYVIEQLIDLLGFEVAVNE